MARHTTQRDIMATERAKQAIALRKQGYTLEEIATMCGYQDKSGAYRAIKRELDRVVVDEVVELRKLELMRLDEMYVECHALFMDKKNKGRLFAADRLLAISESRRKLLGIDKRADDVLGGVTIIREYAVEVSKV